jgi:hypothetical protein
LPPAYRLCSAGTLCEIPLQLAITDETTQSDTDTDASAIVSASRARSMHTDRRATLVRQLLGEIAPRPCCWAPDTLPPKIDREFPMHVVKEKRLRLHHRRYPSR